MGIDAVAPNSTPFQVVDDLIPDFVIRYFNRDPQDLVIEHSGCYQSWLEERAIVVVTSVHIVEIFISLEGRPTADYSIDNLGYPVCCASKVHEAISRRFVCIRMTDAGIFSPLVSYGLLSRVDFWDPKFNRVAKVTALRGLSSLFKVIVPVADIVVHARPFVKTHARDWKGTLASLIWKT